MTDVHTADFANVSFFNRVTTVNTASGNVVTLYVKTKLSDNSVEYFYSIGARADEEVEPLGKSLAAALVVIRHLVADM